VRTKQTRIERRRPSDVFNLKEGRLTSNVEVGGYYTIPERRPTWLVGERRRKATGTGKSEKKENVRL